MYPAHYFLLTPPFPHDHRVFVAMSFAPRFNARWSEVIAPAISAVSIRDTPLTAHRVDRSKSGDSILTEILNEIARCRLIIADVSTVAVVDGQPLRNSNVLYEVGLAHAVRQPEEVLLFRSDNDALPFDIANVRVHSYAPDDDAEGARTIVATTIHDALRELDFSRSESIRRAADSLDYEGWDVLYSLAAREEVRHPTREDVTKRLGLIRAVPRVAAIQRLLTLGAIRTEYERLTPQFVGTDAARSREEIFIYRLTPFGRALLALTLERMGYFAPEISEALDKALASIPGVDHQPDGAASAAHDGSTSRPWWLRWLRG